MREIKFRGKRIDNGEWLYGYYWSNDLGNHFIKVTKDENGFCLYDVEVDPATVGQYIGLNEHLDGTGKEIYKGDRVQVNTHGINYENKWITGVVVFQDGCFEVEFSEPVYDLHDKCYRKRLYVKCFVVNNAIKVIGNIHDNPLEVTP